MFFRLIQEKTENYIHALVFTSIVFCSKLPITY